MGRPRKSAKEFEVTGSDPVLRDDEGYSPADVIADKLTESEVKSTLGRYITAGVDVRVTDKHWFMRKGKLSNSGSLSVPIKALIAAGDFLLAQYGYVEQIIATKRNAKRLGLGESYGGLGVISSKDDLGVDEVA